MSKKKTTEELIDGLARMVKRGFDETATKTDMRRTEERMAEIEERMATKQMLQLAVDNLDLARVDIHDIKLTLGPLVRHMAATEDVLRSHDKRIERLERKVGLGK